MSHEFTVGKRFTAIRVLSMVLNSVVVFVFYLIYRYLLQGSDITEDMLQMTFCLIEAAVICITLWVTKRYADSVYYKIDKNGLTVGRGKRQKLYAWSAFTGVTENTGVFYRFDRVFPITFHLGTEELELNQYVTDVYQLSYEIFQHIRKYADIPEKLWNQADKMRGS